MAVYSCDVSSICLWHHEASSSHVLRLPSEKEATRWIWMYLPQLDFILMLLSFFKKKNPNNAYVLGGQEFEKNIIQLSIPTWIRGSPLGFQKHQSGSY